MATEALDLPRRATLTIRLPHRLRVLARALHIAHLRRVRDWHLAELELRRTNAVARPYRGSWLEDLAATQVASKMLSR